MNQFIRGYEDDAGDDIVLDDFLDIKPGFNTIKLPCTYTPQKGEVAFLVPRGSTAAKGIFPVMVAIDTGYKGYINGWVVNVGDRQVFQPGERAFGIVNFQKAPSRAEGEVTIARPGEERGGNKLGSSGK